MKFKILIKRGEGKNPVKAVAINSGGSANIIQKPNHRPLKQTYIEKYWLEEDFGFGFELKRRNEKGEGNALRHRFVLQIS